MSFHREAGHYFRRRQEQTKKRGEKNKVCAPTGPMHGIVATTSWQRGDILPLALSLFLSPFLICVALFGCRKKKNELKRNKAIGQIAGLVEASKDVESQLEEENKKDLKLGSQHM